MRRRTALMDNSSRSAADRKLPRRTTSRKIRAASQSAKPPRVSLWRSSSGTPLSSARGIHGPFRRLSLAESAGKYNHNGSKPGVFHAYNSRWGTGFLRGFMGGGLKPGRCRGGCRVTSVVGLRTFANSPNVPIVVFVDTQQEYVAAPWLPAISRIDSALDEPSCQSTLIDAFHLNHKVS